MTDATSRARDYAYKREVIARCIAIGRKLDLADQYVAQDIMGELEQCGFRIIDTRTHAVIPREPSDEVVERVARAIAEAWSITFRFEDYDESELAAWRKQARAAIAALTGGQTQGGPGDPPV